MRQDHLLEALEAFEGVVGRPETTAEVDQQAREQIGKITEKVAQLDPGGTPGAALAVDGQPRGTLPLAQPLRLLPGTHTLRATKDGHRPFERQVSAAPGTRVDLEIALEPLPPPAKPRRRYWLWGTVGAAVAAAAVIGIVASTHKPGELPAPPCPRMPCIDIEK